MRGVIRQINFTGRKRLPQGRIGVSLTAEGSGPPRLDATLNLDGLGLPDDASVYVEAYNAVSYQRFPFGTVGNIHPPVNRVLTDIIGDVTAFRVKIVDEKNEHGLLRAHADSLHPSDQAEPAGATQTSRMPLLNVNPVPLGNVIWKVEFSSGEPELAVNNQVPGILEIAQRDRGFRALVFPAVLQEILTRILVVERYDPEANNGWHDRWMKYVRQFVSEDPPDDGADEEQKLEWIEDVVQSFSERFRLCESYIAFQVEERE